MNKIYFSPNVEFLLHKVIALTFFAFFCVDFSHAQTHFQDTSKKCFTIEPFAPVFGQLTVGYEKFTYGKNFSEELKIGVIGLGFKQTLEDEETDFHQYGLFLRYGYKFYKKSRRPSKFFLKPEIYLGVKYAIVSDSIFEQHSVVWFCGLLLNTGRKYLIGEQFTWGWDVGLGYSVVKSDNQIESKSGLPVTPKYVPLNAGLLGPVIGGPRYFPIAISAGLNVGFLF